MEEKLKKLLEDPSFQEALSKTTSAEEASALLAQHAGGLFIGWVPRLPWWPPRNPGPFPPRWPPRRPGW